MSYDVRNQVALVTGANRGIGKAIVDALMTHGAAKVYAAVRSTDSCGELVERYGEKIVPVQLDLSRAESIIAAAKATSDISLVINNAGVLQTSTALDSSAIEALQFEMDVNVYGLIHMVQAFAPILKSNGGGAFVQLNSVASMKSFPAFSTYCASKAAAYSITQALRELLRDQGTTVHSVHPGPILTDMGTAAGLAEIAEPAELVGEAIISGLKNNQFHIFPDSMSKQLGSAYQSFAQSVIEAEMLEG